MQKEMRGINLSNLMWKILFAWKKILATALIVAVLMAGFKYVSDSNDAKTNNSAKLELNETEKANANKLLELYDQLNYYEKYIAESLLMQVDPLCYEAIKLQYYVDTSYIFDFQNGVENDYTPTLMAAYTSYVASDNFINDLKSALNIEAANKYIRELFTVTNNVGSYVVEIVVVVPEDVDSEVMLATMKDIIKGKSDSLQSIGNHTLTEVNASIDEIVSGTMVTQRNTIIKSFDAIKQSISSTTLSLTMSELIYVDENLKYEQYKGGYKYENIEEVSFDVKYAIIGFVLGAFCVVAYYCMIAMFSNKLQDNNDIRMLYGVKILGGLHITPEKRGPVISLLQKVRNRHNETHTYEGQIAKVAAGISLLCEKNSASRIFIASSCLNKIDQKIVDDIEVALKNKNLEISGNGKLSCDADALDTAANSDGIILLEMLEVSVYKQIEQEIVASKDYNMKLLGAVVIE